MGKNLILPTFKESQEEEEEEEEEVDADMVERNETWEKSPCNESEEKEKEKKKVEEWLGLFLYFKNVFFYLKLLIFLYF